jgi:Holliday junction resolvase RusA-like endonuclease
MVRRKTSKKPFTFVVETKPVVKGRPRLGRRGRVFTPVRTLQAEQIIAEHYRSIGGPYYEAPVQLEAVFHPKHIEVTITPLLDHTSTLRGDVDNYLKLLCDALNGVAFPDDKQVMIISGEKR